MAEYLLFIQKGGTKMPEITQKFVGGAWESQIDVRDFIIRNYRSYDGDTNFLKPAAESVQKVGEKVELLLEEERKKVGYWI